MTGSRQGLPWPGTRQWTTHTTISSEPSRSTNTRPSSALNIVHRTAPASRPSGRCAGGLRPRLDPGALLRCVPKRPRNYQEQSPDPSPGLDQPRSFRDDLRFGARGRIRTDDLSTTRRILRVDLDGSRRIWPAHVGCLVGPDGSGRIQKDRLDDHRDDQSASDRKSDGKASSAV
jgi:hypothetical protein